MAEVNAIDFNKIPKQKFSPADMKKVGSIIRNVKTGNMEQATTEFDAFTRDKKMDKVRSIGLKLGAASALILAAIVAPHKCKPWVKNVGDVLATSGAKFVRNHKKLYDKIAKRFPQVVGNVGEHFATRVLDSTSVFEKAIKKFVTQGNGEVAKNAVEALGRRDIKTLGDCVGIATAALASIPAGNFASNIGNVLDEYGDGDRISNREKSEKLNLRVANAMAEASAAGEDDTDIDEVA